MTERKCVGGFGAGRLTKARQFLRSAGILLDESPTRTSVADPYVTLCVHAGIAAADAICCAALGSHHQGDDHRGAVELLRRAEPDGAALARDLAGLLGLKTRAGYEGRPVPATAIAKAGRCAERLVDAANRRAGRLKRA